MKFGKIFGEIIWINRIEKFITGATVICRRGRNMSRIKCTLLVVNITAKTARQSVKMNES